MTKKIAELADEFEKVFLAIYDFYTQDENDVSRWEKIANYIGDNSHVFVELLENIGERKVDQNIPFTDNIKDILESIGSEKIPIKKISFILAAIHHVFYDLMTKKENHLFMLDGKEQMAGLTDDIKYYISINEKTEQNIFFHAYILLYGLESRFVNNLCVGMDFEFTDNIIRLAQLNFEHSVDYRSMILIISPRELTEVAMGNFIEFIMCNNLIKKILHGSDSKDTPYIYTEMLQDDPDRIIQFTRNLTDTKLLCDYYKLNRVNTDNRCSIYSDDPDSSAIYYFGLISKEQQDNLADVLNKMPVDIVWNIHKLSNAQKLYAQYDVIYLKYFYYRIINLAIKDAKNETQEKNIIRIYRGFVNQFTQFSYLESKKITSLAEHCKNDVDPLNNYFYHDKNKKKITLIQVFNKLSVGLVYSKVGLELDTILQVSYFKKKVQFILKRIIYGHIVDKCRVFKNNTESLRITTDSMGQRKINAADGIIWEENTFIVDFFNLIELNDLADLFSDINKKLRSMISVRCPKM